MTCARVASTAWRWWRRRLSHARAAAREGRTQQRDLISIRVLDGEAVGCDVVAVDDEAVFYCTFARHN